MEKFEDDFVKALEEIIKRKPTNVIEMFPIIMKHIGYGIKSVTFRGERKIKYHENNNS